MSRSRLPVLEQPLIHIHSNADTIVNSPPGADFDLIGDLHEEQIIEIACGDSLKSLHVFCKNARLTSDQKIVQVLCELIDVEWDIMLWSETRGKF